MAVSVSSKLPGATPPPPDRASGGVKALTTWIPPIWFAALLLICYGPTLVSLAGDWVKDEDMGHGFFVPLFALYIVWQKRERLLQLEMEPSFWGYPIILFGAVQLWVAALGAELFLSRVAFLISTGGVVLAVGGMRLLRELCFPLILLVFMIPLPAIIYNQITLPLQLLASSIAELTVNWLGIPVIREGNIIELASGLRLSVIEACSGIRSLLTLSFISLVVAYFLDKRVWMRPALLLATLPIAILANGARVTLTVLISDRNPELAEGIFHSVEGWLAFVIALIMLFAVYQVISKVALLIRKR